MKAACSCTGPSDTHRWTLFTPGFISVNASMNSAAAAAMNGHARDLRSAVRGRRTHIIAQAIVSMRPTASCCPQILELTPLRCITKTPTNNAGSGASNNRIELKGNDTNSVCDVASFTGERSPRCRCALKYWRYTEASASILPSVGNKIGGSRVALC